jgi:hypothetical protein
MKKIENENYLCGKTYTDKENGNCVKNSYPSSGNQGGSYITSGGFGTSGNSYNSQEQHIQQISTYLGGNVLGGAYHDQRKNRDSNDGINYQVKGIVSQLNYYGFKDPKGIVLSDCALEDKDTYTLHQAIQYQPLNLTVLDLSNNYLGLNSVHTIFYGFKGHQIKSINLTNNRLGDDSALFISQALEYGNIPALKYIDVSGNNITATGEGYLAKVLGVVSQDLKIVLEVVKGFSKDALKTTMKSMLSIAKSNGISTKEALTTDETIQHCIKGGVNVGLNIGWGVAKCTITPLKFLNLKDVTLQDIGLDLLSYTIPQTKGAIAFTCVTQNTFFSVVDESFANCLVGVDSLLNE